MRALILFVFLCEIAFGRSCKEFEKVADYLNTQKFIKASRDHRVLKVEAQLNVDDLNQARTLAYRFPAFKDLGFGIPGGEGWKVYEGRMERSVLNGKKVGWEIKNENGHARIRLDWDPQKGAHYNLEITEKKAGKSETHKLAINFLCQGQKCSEDQIKKMAENL
jgi:hypothetical protein